MLLFFLAIVAALSALSCDSKPVQNNRIQQTEIDLLDRPFSFRRFSAREGYDLVQSQSAELLSIGWSQCNTKAVPNHCWTNAPEAAIDFPLLGGKGDLEIQLDLRLPEVPRMRAQKLDLRWNGALLDTIEFRTATRHKIKIPSQEQQVGVNRLLLQPHYWFQPSAIDTDSLDRRNLGLNLYEIHLSRKIPSETRESRTSPGSPGLKQLTDELLTFALTLPANAKIHFGLTVDKRRKGSVPIGLVTVSLQLDGSRSIHLKTIDLAKTHSLERIEWTSDPQFTGSMHARLNLSYASSRDSKTENSEPTPPEAITWTKLLVHAKTRNAQRVETPKGRYNIMILLLDTLRADHTEPYGGSGTSTPEITRLATSGTTFTRATANTSWTRTSVASMLTGLYPGAHKVQDRKDTLPTQIPYLPELLRQAGYQTIFVNNNPNLDDTFQMTRGFSRVAHLYKDGKYATATDRNSYALRSHVFPLLEEVADEPDPFFMYVHEIDPHEPYEPPSQFGSAYASGYETGIQGSVQLMDLISANIMRIDEWSAEKIRSLYQGEITYMDAYLGKILRKLDQLGVREDTLFLLVSDHGEEFLEHQGVKHGRTLYQEQLAIPMIWSLPGVIPSESRIASPAQLVDVTPTILDLLGIDEPKDMQGESRLATIITKSDKVSDDRPTHAELQLDSANIASIRLEDWKLIGATQRKTGTRKWQLFNLAADPDEKINRIAQHPVIADALRTGIAHYQESNRILSQAFSSEEASVDEEMTSRLEALGYLE